MRGAYANHPERRADRAGEPRPTEPLGKAPGYMTAAQKKIWKEIEGMVVPGLLTKQDRFVVELATVLLAKIRSAEAKPQEISTFTALLGKMGMSPADRSKVSVTPPPKPESDRPTWSSFTPRNANSSPKCA
jgi:hypothetical protein